MGSGSTPSSRMAGCGESSYRGGACTHAVRVSLDAAREPLDASSVVVEQFGELLPRDDDAITMMLSLVFCFGVFREHLLERIRIEQFAWMSQSLVPSEHVFRRRKG